MDTLDENSKTPRRLMWGDVAHIFYNNLVGIVLIGFFLGWRFAVLLVGWSFWDLGTHQAQHDEHKSRRHIHVPFRIFGMAVGIVGTYLLHMQR